MDTQSRRPGSNSAKSEENFGQAVKLDVREWRILIENMLRIHEDQQIIVADYQAMLNNLRDIRRFLRILSSLFLIAAISAVAALLFSAATFFQVSWPVSPPTATPITVIATSTNTPTTITTRMATAAISTLYPSPTPSRPASMCTIEDDVVLRDGPHFAKEPNYGVMPICSVLQVMGPPLPASDNKDEQMVEVIYAERGIRGWVPVRYTSYMKQIKGEPITECPQFRPTPMPPTPLSTPFITRLPTPILTPLTPRPPTPTSTSTTTLTPTSISTKTPTPTSTSTTTPTPSLPGSICTTYYAVVLRVGPHFAIELNSGVLSACSVLQVIGPPIPASDNKDEQMVEVFSAEIGKRGWVPVRYTSYMKQTRGEPITECPQFRPTPTPPTPTSTPTAPPTPR